MQENSKKVFVGLTIISNWIGNFSKRSDRIQTRLYAQGFSQDIDEVVIHIWKELKIESLIKIHPGTLILNSKK